MSEQAPEQQDAAYAEGEESRIVSLDALSAKVDKLAEAVSKILPGSHAEAERRTESRLDRASSVEEQVRAELARRDREAAEKQDAEAKAREHEDLKATVAKLAERAPQPAERRSTRMMWGGQR